MVRIVLVLGHEKLIKTSW